MEMIPARFLHRLTRAVGKVWGEHILPNTLVGLPGGTAAYAGMHKPSNVASQVFQPVLLMADDGQLWGTAPSYVACVPLSSLGPSGRVHLAFYNSSFSGVTVELEALMAQKNMAAITGAAFSLQFNRITSLGPVGTGVGSIGGAPVPAQAFDPTFPTLPSSAWFTNLASANNIGGVTSMFTLWMHSEETNVAAQVQEAQPLWPPLFAQGLKLPSLTFPPGYGFTVSHVSSVQGAYTFMAICRVSSG